MREGVTSRKSHILLSPHRSDSNTLIGMEIVLLPWVVCSRSQIHIFSEMNNTLQLWFFSSQCLIYEWILSERRSSLSKGCSSTHRPLSLKRQRQQRCAWKQYNAMTYYSIVLVCLIEHADYMPTSHVEYVGRNNYKMEIVYLSFYDIAYESYHGSILNSRRDCRLPR